MDFLQCLQQGILLCDGAMGTILQQDGLLAGQCPEEWNLLHPATIRRVHQAYVAAGADIIETNSFGGNRARLDHYHLGDRVAEINQWAVELAREAGGEEVLVAAAMGPTGRFLAPAGDLEPEDAVALYREQAEALVAGGPDLIIIETMADKKEAECAVRAVQDVSQLPILVQMTFTEKGTTIFGATPEEAVSYFTKLGVAAIGANCSVGPGELVPIVERFSKVSTLPISVQPNAGMPVLDDDGDLVYPFGPEEFAAWGPELIGAGARILGGCCGTTPQHIAALRKIVK